MSNAAEKVEQDEGAGLDAMLDNFQEEEAEQERQENMPDPKDIEKARKLAARMNKGFLYGVNRFQCPHVDIDELVDRKEGDEAFYGLAEKWKGEPPAWVEGIMPYVHLGIYMGVTISVARKAETAVVEEAKQRYLAQQREQGSQGAADGD